MQSHATRARHMHYWITELNYLTEFPFKETKIPRGLALNLRFMSLLLNNRIS